MASVNQTQTKFKHFRERNVLLDIKCMLKLLTTKIFSVNDNQTQFNCIFRITF